MQVNKIFLLSLLTVICCSEARANFGGYERGNTEGFGSSFNIIHDNAISLEKERLEFTLDQRVGFKGHFEFKNTSESIKKATFAFPQNSFWEVPYENGYAPGNYFVLSPVIKINGKELKNIEHLFTERMEVYPVSFKALTKDEMKPLLINWAETHEAEESPSMPIVLWLVFDHVLLPLQTVVVDIEFKVPWYFQDEIWSNGVKTSGIRTFEYITSTAATWKDATVKDFEAKVSFPEDVGKHLSLYPQYWTKISPTQASIVKHNFAPTNNDHIKFSWQSKYELYSADSWDQETDSVNENIAACWKNISHKNYQWRFLTDNSVNTSWCIKPSGLTCPQYRIKKIYKNDDKKLFSHIKIANGFAKTEGLYKNNSRPKKITFFFQPKTKSKAKWSQQITLKDIRQSQIFKLNIPVSLSEYDVSFKIDEVFSGVKSDDICISEFDFLE